MIEVFIYGYITSVHIYICGYLFFYSIVDKKVANNSNFFELFFWGAFVLCFIALFTNFFLSLNKTFNTILLFLPFVLFLFFFNRKIIKDIFLLSIPISLLFVLTIAFDGTYRPDAGSYHLPFISILNENKILIGINNIHFRFGHTSIIQYFSSIYNNYIFDEKGILIPLGLIFCNFIGYCLKELYNIRNSKEHKILVFLFLSFVLFRVNRYSDFGNDAPANLIFFYLILESVKNNDNLLKIKKTVFASTFIFLNKVTLLLAFLVPIYFILKTKNLKNIINKVSFLSLVFILLYSGKNILVSGCVIFPIEQTCLKNLYWYDKDSNRGSNALNARLENEAWTKGWVNQTDEKKPYKIYLEDYNWINTWIKSEGKKISKKILPFISFIFLILIFLIFYEIKNKTSVKLKQKEQSDLFICLIICILGSVLWFLKFPVFRYGYGYLASTFGIIIVIFVKNFEFFRNELNIKKYAKYLSVFMLSILFLKNSIRIYDGYISESYIWPNIYESGKLYEKKINLPIKKNNQIIFYKSASEECYYSKSPCTHFYNGDDFTLNEIMNENKFGYTIYYFMK